MTVTEQASVICLFETKVGEALSYVPKMSASEKLRAVHFWNVISEKLQDIVNNCAADIHEVVLKMGECDSEKILDMNSSNPVDIGPHSNMSSDFSNLTSNYELCSGTSQQFQNLDIESSHFSSYDSFPVTPEIPSNSIAFCPNNQITTQLNSSLSSCENTFSSVNTLSYHDSSTSFVNPFYTHEASNKTVSSVENDHSHSKDTISSETFKSFKNLGNLGTNSDLSSVTNSLSLVTQLCKDGHITVSKSPKKVTQKRSVCFRNKESPTKACLSPKRTISKKSPTKKLSLRNVLKMKRVGYDNDKNVGASLSDSEADFVRVEDNTRDRSNSVSLEPIVSFVVSNTEEILSNNDIELKEEGITNSTVTVPECDEKEQPVLDPPKYKCFVCDECSSEFSTKGNLNVHKRIHTGEKPYACTKCSARFRTRGNLKRHIKIHTGEKQFECDTCGSRFVEKKSLIVHVRCHTGEKPYKCTQCGRSFSQFGVLQSHLDMHMGKRSHLCELCGKSFTQRSQLRIHKLRHDNIKKQECTVCSTKFLTKGELERHMRIHTGEKPFICDLCSKTFTRQQSLNEHKNRHLGVRPYVCKQCNKTFFEMSACYKHEKWHDKKKKNHTSDYSESKTKAPSQGSEEGVNNNVKYRNGADKSGKNSKILRIPSSNNSQDANVETYQIIKLCTTDALKPFSEENAPQQVTSSETQQTLSTFIENFFVEL